MKNSWISYVAIILSVLAILLVIFRITPIEFTNETYIGIIASFIGISVTLLIGYQIINTLEIKKEMSEQRKRSNELGVMFDEAKQSIEMQKYEVQEGFDIINTLINYQAKGKRYSLDAFMSLHHALVSSINTDRDDYEWMFDLFREYISNIDYHNIYDGATNTLQDGSFVGASSGTKNYQKDIRECIMEYTNIIDVDEEKIRNNRNFIRIKIEYDKIMRLFKKRISELISNPVKDLTIEEKENIRNNE
ncbi:MAG: hypothetical protein H6Q16_551 [Bacteroidetes bacterium]|nr:hypothetical protein [Bacteroidota bacterium]